MVYILHNGILFTNQQSTHLCYNRDDPHCDIWLLIRNMCLVIISWHRATKTIGISCDKNSKDIFCCVIMVTCGKPLGNLRLGAGCQGRGWNFQYHPCHQPPGGERGWRLNQLLASDLISCAYLMELLLVRVCYVTSVISDSLWHYEL